MKPIVKIIHGPSFRYMLSRKSFIVTQPDLRHTNIKVSIVEIAAGVIISCMPATAAIFKHYRRRKSGSHDQGASAWRLIELELIRNDSRAHLKQDFQM